MKRVADMVVLSGLEAPAGRRFAHPDHIAADRATLEMLIADFRRHLANAGPSPAPVLHHVPDDQSWFRRVLIPDPAAACDRTAFAVVGFFGRRRIDVDPEVTRLITELSRELDAVIPTVPGLLGYSTHLLVDEVNYANLVMLDSPDVVETWRQMRPHPMAAEVASPGFYDHVRIYNGSVVFSEPEPSSLSLELDHVKYWDFREQPAWRAVRTVQER